MPPRQWVNRQACGKHGWNKENSLSADREPPVQATLRHEPSRPCSPRSQFPRPTGWSAAWLPRLTTRHQIIGNLGRSPPSASLAPQESIW